MTEGEVQNLIRLEAARRGLMLWRNNVGALKDDTGRYVRYGLANDSKGMNVLVKSGDLIGIRSVVVTPVHVGHVIGQFISIESKRSDWRYNPTDEHEQAQSRWAALVNDAGGMALFATGPEVLP